MYCKRGYFRWGKFRENVGKTFHVGLINFYDTTIAFIKAYGFYFSRGVIFAKETKARKTQKIPHAKISTFKAKVIKSLDPQ